MCLFIALHLQRVHILRPQRLMLFSLPSGKVVPLCMCLNFTNSILFSCEIIPGVVIVFLVSTHSYKSFFLFHPTVPSLL